jgi:subtilisin family serine protease
MRKQLLLAAVAAAALSVTIGGAFAQTNDNPKYQRTTPRNAVAPKNTVMPRVNQTVTPRTTMPAATRVVPTTPGVKGGMAPTRMATPTGPRGGNMGGGRNSGGNMDGGHRGGGWGGVATGLGAAGVIMSLPGMIPPAGGQQIVDDPADYQQPVRRSAPRQQQPQQRATNRGPSGVPPANERRMVPDEVVLEIPNSVSPAQINALQQRFRLTRLESQTFALTGTTLYRWRVPRDISVPRAVQAIEGDARVASAQPNYLFTLQQDAQPAKIEMKLETKFESGPKPDSLGDPAQYGLGKMRLPQAHGIAKGDNVLVAVIDSGIDGAHPELNGAIAQSYDATGDKAAVKPHTHGTAMASLIAAHGKLLGAAPAARILAIRAFDPAGKSAEGTTFNILKGLNFAAANGARVINMSFAGPSDPAIHRSLEAARKKGIVLVAAAGNEGAKSAPLYPAADPNVIAVSATDADDQILEQSNRGNHIAIAAPGAQIMVAIPDGGYEMSSGTSHAAAEVSGIIALMLERKPGMTPDQARGVLLATARDIGAPGRDPLFGAGLADAYAAITAGETPVARTPTAEAGPPVERVSGAR